MIKNSLDYPTYRDQLMLSIKALPYNRELRKMLSNIDDMVSELSKAEVQARRGHKDIAGLPELKRVNESIKFLEQWIVMGALIGN